MSNIFDTTLGKWRALTTNDLSTMCPWPEIPQTVKSATGYTLLHHE